MNGNVVFYTTADCICYVTLYSVLSAKYGIRTYSFSLMPNHIHSLQEAQTKKTFVSFNYEMSKEFAKRYNAWHKREGPLFESPPVFRNGTPILAVSRDEPQQFGNLRLFLGMKEH